MAITNCKECKKEVSSKAKACPHCGVKEPGAKKSDTIGGIIVMLLIMFAVYKCSGDTPEETSDNRPAVNQVFEIKNGNPQEYKIIGEQDYSFSGRTRLNVYISAPDANTLEDRAATVQKAAKEFLRERRAHQVTAYLEGGNSIAKGGNHLAIATYTPDGCGNGGDKCTGKAWEIEASGEKYKPGTYVTRKKLT